MLSIMSVKFVFPTKNRNDTYIKIKYFLRVPFSTFMFEQFNKKS